ncbi:MAG: hypothetical protein A2X47_10030 [Lentisphaerae bacterium GWF2_38_69]|nr:MAG: hypothetical protein A2X47_10030 [Lentisphaerae bacterium GWF2_38_69]
MIWFYGIITIIIQTLLLRELVSLFRSNELTVSIMFFCWFIGTAFGSSLFRHFPEIINRIRCRTAFMLFFANTLFLLEIILIRFVFSQFQYESEPNIFLLSGLFLIFTFPLSFLIGSAFTSLLLEYNKNLSCLYFVEGAAAFIGGLIFTFVIAGHFDAVITVSALIFVSALFLIRRRDIKLSVRILIFLLSVLIFILSPYLSEYSRILEWHNNDKLLLSKESKYGYIAEIENRELKTIYFNGAVLSNSSLESQYEEDANLPFLIRANLKNICVIGFASKSLLDEFKKYKPDNVTVIIQDEVLANLIRKDAAGADFPLKVIQSDPVNALTGLDKKFDLIYINTSLPKTIAQGFYYSDFFYRRASEILTSDGILALSVPYEENNLSSYSLINLKTIYHTLRSIFPYVEFAPVSSFHFFASNKVFPPLQEKMLQSISNHKLLLNYINPAYIKYYLESERISRYSNLIQNPSGTSVNSLFSFELYNNNLKKWLLNNISNTWIVLLVALIICIIALKRYFKSINIHLSVTGRSSALFVIGFTSIVGEILFLNYYQTLTGGLYSLYGLLTALFMLGLSVGGYLVCKFKIRYFSVPFLLLLVWLIGIESLFDLTSSGLLTETVLISSICFFWNFTGGFVLGLLFNTFAVRMEESGFPGAITTSEIYSADLAGSAFGALLTGPLILPSLGHTITIVIMCMLLGIVMIYAKK